MLRQTADHTRQAGHFRPAGPAAKSKTGRHLMRGPTRRPAHPKRAPWSLTEGARLAAWLPVWGRSAKTACACRILTCGGLRPWPLCSSSTYGLQNPPGNLGKVQSLLCDAGYVGEPFAQGVREILGQHVRVQIAKRSELHSLKVMLRRWVVERSFAWLEKNRRLWKNCERLLNTSLQFVHWAFLALIFRRL